MWIRIVEQSQGYDLLNMVAGFTLRQDRGWGWVMAGKGLSLLFSLDWTRKSGLKDRSNNVKQLGSPMESVREGKEGIWKGRKGSHHQCLPIWALIVCVSSVRSFPFVVRLSFCKILKGHGSGRFEAQCGCSSLAPKRGLGLLCLFLFGRRSIRNFRKPWDLLSGWSTVGSQGSCLWFCPPMCCLDVTQKQLSKVPAHLWHHI